VGKKKNEKGGKTRLIPFLPKFGVPCEKKRKRGTGGRKKKREGKEGGEKFVSSSKEAGGTKKGYKRKEEAGRQSLNLS